MLTVLWADQEPVPADDRGLAYGDGLFETIRIEGRRPLLLARHLARLVRGAEVLDIPLDQAALGGALEEALVRHGRAGAWVLKLQLTRGSGGRGYRPPESCRPRLIISAHPLPAALPESGVSAGMTDYPLVVNPRLAGLKTLNRLDQVMASRDLDDSLYEVIMADPAGNLVEGTRTNLLLRYGRQWLVPPRHCLAVAGVMLDWVTDRLIACGETVVEQPLVPSLLTSPHCRGLYLLNSVVGHVAVRSLGEWDLPLDDGLATICGPLEELE